MHIDMIGFNESHSNLIDLAGRALGGTAAGLPGATALYRGARLYHCCGGQTTLRSAAASRSLDLDRLVSDLERLARTWRAGAAAARCEVLTAG